MNLPLAAITLFAFAVCTFAAGDNAPVAPATPAKADDCHCDDKSPEQLRGFAFKGRVVAILAAQGEVRVTFGEIPGVLPAGTREFKAEPAVLSAVEPGREILARIEQRNGEWWLFAVRLLIPLPAKT